MAIKDFRFDNLPQSTRIIIFAVVVVCMAAAFYMYYLKDMVTQRNDLQTKIQSLELSVAQGTAIKAQLRQFEQDLAELEERLARLQSILPAAKETPALLRSVQQMATSSNLRIDRFAPQPMVPQSFYSDWPIQLDVQGNYNALGLFFEKISRAHRIIDIGNLTIKGIEKQNDPAQTLTASCTATTYVFMDQPAVVQEQPQKKEKKR
jgi:type IV pilus assembly protein PilO